MEYEKERLKALHTIEAGTITQRVDLITANKDITENRWNGVNLQPLLNGEEAYRLERTIKTPREHEKLQAAEYYYKRTRAAAAALYNWMLPIEQAIGRLEFYILSWADAEELELVANVALRSIPDLEQRKATAIGLAKQIDHRGCCQTVTDDGLLMVSTTNVMEDIDLERAITSTARSLVYMMSYTKAGIEATREYMEAAKIKMPATKMLLANIEQNLSRRTLNEKYADRQQMLPGQKPSQELLGKGKLLYDAYRVMPAYKDIQPLQMAKQHFNRTLLTPYEKR